MVRFTGLGIRYKPVGATRQRKEGNINFSSPERETHPPSDAAREKLNQHLQERDSFLTLQRQTYP